MTQKNSSGKIAKKTTAKSANSAQKSAKSAEKPTSSAQKSAKSAEKPAKPTEKSTGTSLIIPNVKLTITLAKAQVAQKYEQILKQLSKSVATSGFRKGKVPSKIAEEKLGQTKIIEQVLDALLPEAYQKTLQESKNTPITQPEISIVSVEMGKDWIVEAEFAQLPTVNLKDYQKHAKAGLKAGEKTLAEQKKARDKNNKAGQADKSKAKDKTPSTPQPAPTADQEKEIKLQHIFRELVLQLKPQVPQMLLKHETQHEFEHLVSQLKQLNISVDDYLKRRSMDMEKLSQELAVSTLNSLQLDLVLGAIAKEKKFTTTDQDRAKYFEQIKDEKQREQLSKDPHYLGHLDTNLTKQKVVDYLLKM
ncbi:MAG: trigger factor [Candidatus Paceibacterota bacterium]